MAVAFETLTNDGDGIDYGWSGYVLAQSSFWRKVWLVIIELTRL
jgi:hypothetical protein